MKVLKDQLEERDKRMVVMSLEMDALRDLNLQSYSKGREEGILAGQASAVAAYKSSPEFSAEVMGQATLFYADAFTVGLRSQVENLNKQLSEESGKALVSQEETKVLKDQLEERDKKLAMMSLEMDALRVSNLQSYSKGREEGILAGQASVLASIHRNLPDPHSKTSSLLHRK
ncbi:hypothetical protein Salat_2100300 [Sesamum alatum]|uniref:Uncharacterized protein n=1 Tax=Sesamum alatum TaxID=300844 RepID=A0AAE1Y1F6_9LAMI|nr:hypothetical protein Salat_2100300 [Sesamum alatum]